MTFTASTSKGKTRIRGQLAAPNLATHKPTDLARWVDLSQVSSGKRVGRFVNKEDAVAFARAVVLLIPELVDGGKLTLAQIADLGELRKVYNGRQW